MYVRNLYGCGQPLSQLTWCLCFQRDTFFGDLIGRDAALREVGDCAIADAAGGYDRISNPVLATAASMGAGKTAFLQELPRRLANHENSEYREFMQETVGCEETIAPWIRRLHAGAFRPVIPCHDLNPRHVHCVGTIWSHQASG